MLEADDIKLPHHCVEKADGEIVERRVVEGERVSLNPYVIFRIGEPAPARIRRRTTSFF